jgi:CRP-like cAMP-binding protein
MSNTNSLLHNVYLFKALTPKELEAVSSIAKVESFVAGDEIFMQADVAKALYIVKHGTVKVQHSGKEDRVDVATLGTGAHFGEMAFLDGEKRSASVVVTERGEIVRIDFQDLHKVLNANPEISTKVYRSMAHFLCGRLRVTTTDLTYAREKNLHHF